MTYTSKWERLSNAVERIMKSTSVSREQIQTDICSAISDRAIDVRAKLLKHATRLQTSGSLLRGNDLHIPPKLKPHDLDWEQSRPTNPWLIRNLPPLHHGPWHLDWLELFAADVSQELLPPDNSSMPTSSEAPIGPKRKERTKSKRMAAELAVKELFSGLNPPQYVLSNDQLFDKVTKYLEKINGPHVSRETVLRAAGRRRK